MTYDRLRKVVVLFGGAGDELVPFGDTWHWDGSTWRAIPGAGPPARRTCAMAYDDARHNIVMFGGATERQTIGRGDMWILE